MARLTFLPPAGLAGRRLAIWLRDRLAVRGVAAVGPMAGDFSAALKVNAQDGFVSIRLLPPRAGIATLDVERFGEAEAEYEDALFACEDALAPRRASSG